MGVPCLIVEDHKLVSDSLVMALESKFPDFEFTHVFNSRDAIEFIERNRGVDCCMVILDLGLVDQHGITVLMHLKKEKLTNRFLCLVMSGMENQGNVNLCKKEGARGFISKADDADTLIDAVRLIRDGGDYFPPFPYEHAGNFLETAVKLVPHLQKTLDLVLQGCMTKVIASELNLTVGSAENNVNRLLPLFSVKTRAELIREAHKCGYIPQYKIKGYPGDEKH
jgi:DNA-binding NarL/FixJ family response regulator